MFKCDYHTHSCFSPDAAPESTVEALCHAAIANGITDLAITDHFESNWREVTPLIKFDTNEVYKAVFDAKEKFKDKLNLTFGIEIGQANQCPDEAQRFLQNCDFEFVISSIHNLKGETDFYYFDFGKIKGTEQQDSYIASLFERNINEICDAIDVLPIVHTIGHLTYIKRYCAMAGLEYDFSKHAEKAEQLFKKMIAREIALEVNVSTLWQGFDFAMPDTELLSVYRDCGGRLITVGTDSHSPAHIGEYVSKGFELIKNIGLNEVLVIRNGERTVIKI